MGLIDLGPSLYQDPKIRASFEEKINPGSRADVEGRLDKNLRLELIGKIRPDLYLIAPRQPLSDEDLKRGDITRLCELAQELLEQLTSPATTNSQMRQVEEIQPTDQVLWLPGLSMSTRPRGEYIGSYKMVVYPNSEFPKLHHQYMPYHRGRFEHPDYNYLSSLDRFIHPTLLDMYFNGDDLFAYFFNEEGKPRLHYQNVPNRVLPPRL